MVYNGDEVSGIVVDFGSHTTRAGYAGEDTPRVVCPSFYGYLDDAGESSAAGDGDVSMDGNGDGDGGSGGAKRRRGRKYYVGDDGIGVWRKGMEVGSFVHDGMVSDAEPAAAMLQYVLHDRLGLDPREHPLMLTEPAWNTSQSRELLAELAFEGEHVPALYFGSSGVLSAFAAGKPTALVLDVGYSNSSAVPVVDGYALRAGTMRQPLAAHLLNSQLHAHFARPAPPAPPGPGAAGARDFPLSLAPRQLVAQRDPGEVPGRQARPVMREDRAGSAASWVAWAQEGVVEQWKEACAEVVNYKGFDFQTAKDLPQSLYEFPDGYHQHFGEERFRFSEMLFDPKNYFDQRVEPPAALRAVPNTPHSRSLKDLVPLSQLVHDSIMACDVDVRATLLQNIVVVGNGSLVRGLTERLDLELAALMPSQKIKIHSPTIPFERKYASWLGGSVLASLGTFHQLWITKNEYEEHGMQIIHQRCK